MNREKIIRGIKLILFISMLVLIYFVSPKITDVIKNGAKYLYELDGNYITRVVELGLSISFVIAVLTNPVQKKKGGK